MNDTQTKILTLLSSYGDIVELDWEFDTETIIKQLSELDNWEQGPNGKKGINLTLGLNYKRMSPAHGTAKNIKEFDKQAKMWQGMYDELVRNMKQKGIPLEVKIMPKDFTKNMKIAFEGKTPWIANSKLLQLRFLHMVSKFKKDEISEEKPPPLPAKAPQVRFPAPDHCSHSCKMVRSCPWATRKPTTRPSGWRRHQSP